jgi:hypothetical protein
MKQSDSIAYIHTRECDSLPIEQIADKHREQCFLIMAMRISTIIIEEILLFIFVSCRHELTLSFHQRYVVITEKQHAIYFHKQPIGKRLLFRRLDKHAMPIGHQNKIKHAHSNMYV